MILVVLMIVRFAKIYKLGPVRDCSPDVSGDFVKFKIGGNQGDVCSAMVQTVQMGNGDFFGMVGVINLLYIHILLLQGLLVGYAIIVPCSLINFIIGGGVAHMEFLIYFVGSVFFVILGCLCLSYESYVTGVFTLGIGVLLLVDFGLTYKNTK